MILIPLGCLFAAISVVSLFFHQRGLFTYWEPNLMVFCFAASGVALSLVPRVGHFVRWIPSVAMFFVQAFAIVIAKRPAEWYLGVPSFLYTLGPAVASCLIFSKYAAWAKITKLPEFRYDQPE